MVRKLIYFCKTYFHPWSKTSQLVKNNLLTELGLPDSLKTFDSRQETWKFEHKLTMIA